MREQSKETFSAGSPHPPPSHRTPTRTLRSERCLDVSSGDPVSANPLFTAQQRCLVATQGHRLVSKPCLSTHGRKKNNNKKKTEAKRCAGLTDHFCSTVALRHKSLILVRGAALKAKLVRAWPGGRSVAGRREERGCFQSSTQQGGEGCSLGRTKGCSHWLEQDPVGLFNGTSSIQ